MGIVNPTLLGIYDDIPKELLEYVEDVILNRKDDATQIFYFYKLKKIKVMQKEYLLLLIYRLFFYLSYINIK